ncbi:MAG: ATP-binding protein, partial [Chloroflexi bacterium]|nr:ATP-binding protein [Chloroflexota bacterium]
MTVLRLAAWLVPGSIIIGLVVASLPSGAAAVVAVAALLITAFAVRAARDPAATGAPSGPPPPADALGADLHPLLDRFAEGVLLLSDEGTVLAANEAAAAILHRPRTTMLGVSLIRASRDHALVDLIRERTGRTSEIVLGDQQLVQATATPVVYGDFRTVLTLRDVTALRRAERARQELIANVSHELRTPITAALALAETLESGVEEADQRQRFHHQLTSEIERLGTMVDRLLRLSRIESRAEEFQFEAVDVEDLVDEAVRRIGPVAEQRGVQLDQEVAPGTPTVRADRERILEVLANLADNAIRHSPEGGQVSLRATADGTRVRIDVKDHGPGIMPQDRGRVFERFYTAD